MSDDAFRMNRAAERHTYRLIEARETAVFAAGARIIHDGSQLTPDLYGSMVPNRAGRRAIFVTDEYDDMVFDAVDCSWCERTNVPDCD